MNKHILKRMMTLTAVPGLAVIGLLLVSLALGRSASGAIPAKMRPDTGSFTPVTFTPEITLNKEEHVCGGVWVTETVDSDGDVGWDTSLALEPTYPYAPHISYGKVITDHDSDLKHTWLSGTTWLSETVDRRGGEWTSLALAPTYPHTPSISHADYWETWQLRYACRDGITWTIQTLSPMRAGFAGTSLALEPIYPYTPHISYRNPWDTIKTLYHVYLSGTVWASGTWMYERVEPPLSGAGAWSSLALEPTYPYTPHISYGAAGGLKHAWRSGTTWLSETVDSEVDVGWYTSLALDSSSKPHISYFDNTHGSVKYAWLSGATWLSETVDGVGWPRFGAGATSLKLDHADVPYISYYDANSDDLKLAWLKGGVWIIQTVDSEGNVGESSSLALDQAGRPHISYYDATNGDLKYAHIRPQNVTFRKSADEPSAMPGARLTYHIVVSPELDIAMARVTDTLPSAVTWAGVLSATSGSARYSGGTITWTGPLSANTPLTITYGVTVTYEPWLGLAVPTDIYTDVYNDAVMDDGQGNIFTSTPALSALGYPFGTGSDRTFAVAVGDADNDGDLDLAVGNHGPNQICWNNGDGTFDCEDEFVSTGPTFDMEWGDTNNDGYLDLVVANSLRHSNLVCLNNRGRTFTCTAFSSCLGPDLDPVCSVALGDVDKDGNLDIALGNRAGPDLIYYGNGDGTFPITATSCYTGATLDLALGDLDNDSWLDLAVVGHSPDYVCINDGSGKFNVPVRWLAFRLDNGTWRVALGDVDRDDDLDIATGEDRDYPIEIYLNDGHGYFTEKLLVGPAWHSSGGLAWGDVDKDSDLDLATANSNGRIVVYFNDPVTATGGVTFTRQLALGADPSWANNVALGDVDRDGYLDLAVGINWGQNVVYINTTLHRIYLPIIFRN